MSRDAASSLTDIPALSHLLEIVRETLGEIPIIKQDRSGLSGHRARIFDDPPSIELIYSEVAIARFIRMADAMFISHQKESSTLFADWLCLMRGSELALTNRAGGLGIIAQAMTRQPLKLLSLQDGFQRAVTAAVQGGKLELVELLFPLAHEIGHLPNAQKFCPPVIFSDEIFETYKIQAGKFTEFLSEFDYLAAANDASSPLHLDTMRTEIASDYYASAVVVNVMAKCIGNGAAYPIVELVTGILAFPLAMSFDQLFVRKPRTPNEMQHIALAMQIRYSLCIDSVRATLKGLFKAQTDRDPAVERTIDDSVDQVADFVDGIYRTAWIGMIEASQRLVAFGNPNGEETVEIIRSAVADLGVRFLLADLFDVLAADAAMYPLEAHNYDGLLSYGRSLRTFDTMIVSPEGRIVAAYT